MSAKGINPFEAHWEKLVVGVVILVSLGILVMQFTSSRQVTVGGREVPIDKAYGEVEARALGVKSQLDAYVEADELPLPPEGSPGFEAFHTSLDAGVSPNARLATAIGGRGAAIDATEGVGTANDVRLATVAVPAVSRPIASTVLGTMDPIEYKNEPDVRALLADPEVPDIVAVSVQSSFDAASFRNQLQRDPDGPAGPQVAIPRAWWVDQLEIVLVELEREELGLDGTWGNRTTVEQMPGRFTLAAEIETVAAPDQMVDLVRAAGEYAQQIRRPRFYGMIFGEEWVEPANVEEVAVRVAVLPAVKRELGRLEQLQKRIDAAIKGVQKEGGTTQEPLRLEVGGADGGRNQPPPRDGRGGRGGRNQPQPRDDGPNQRRIDSLLARLDGYVEQETEMIQGLLDDGVPRTEINLPSNWPADNERPEQQRPELDEPSDLPLLASEGITLWSHDVTVERGVTYRYRMIVSVNNPMYGHDAGLAGDQKELANERVVESEPSAWSDPVHVDAETYFFITSAHEGGQDDIGLARGARGTATIASFRWGYWRTGTVSLTPGDIIAGPVEAPKLAEMLAGLLEAIPDADPNADPGFVQRPGDRMDPRARPGAPFADRNDPFALDREKIDFEQVPVRHDAVFLDVTATPGIEEVRRAFVRSGDGRIAAFNPEDTQVQPTFLRINRSAKLGREALVPRENEEENVGRPGDIPPPPPGGRPGFPPPGGGGGGGGG